MNKIIGCFCAALSSLTVLPSRSLADVGGEVTAHEFRSVRGWVAMSGASLKGTLEGWGRVAGWSVVWDSDVDYILESSASFPGDFEEAVGRLVDAIYIDKPEIEATLYSGNRVLRIQRNPLSSN